MKRLFFICTLTFVLLTAAFAEQTGGSFTIGQQ